MKHSTKRILAIIMVVLLQLCLLTSATAATVTRDGLQLSLSTDKESYKTGDSILCTVDLVNNSDQELTVAYDVELPEGLELAVAQRGIVVVPSADKASSTFTVQAYGKGADGVPSTGDSFPLMLAGILFVAATAVCFVLTKNKKRFMSFMLIFVLAFGMVQPMMNSAAAEEEAYVETPDQIDFEGEMTEEEHLKMLDEAELKYLATMPEAIAVLGKTLSEFSLTENVYVDNYLATIRVNVTVSNGLEEDLEGEAKATLGKVNLKPITIAGRTKFTLNWNAVSGATHYEVWHYTSKGYVKKVTTTKLTYTLTDGNGGVMNTYRVRAIKKSGTSIVAAGAFAYRSAYGMNGVTNATVKHNATSSAYVRINWKSSSFNHGYHIYRSVDGSSGSYKYIGSANGVSTTTFLDKVGNGYYKIRPYYKKDGVQYLGPSTFKSMPAQYRALIIGQSYDTWSSNQLPGCANDAKSMKAMLNTMKTTKYRAFDVKLRQNLTSSQILSEIKSLFGRAKSNDISVFYYSGHGTSSGWMCGIDSEYNYDYVTVDQLRTALDAIPGKKLVIMDCCYSGAYINKDLGNGVTMVSDKASADAFNNSVIKAFSDGAASKANLATSNYYVLTACSKYQTSAELISSGTRFGAFTYSLLWASGYNERSNTLLSTLEGDTNGDSKLTLKELYTFCYNGVNSLGESIGFDQSVQVYPLNSSFVCWAK